MRLTGQRWRFEIGNSLVFVDNAFNLLRLWSQERVVVNGETVAEDAGYVRTRTMFSTPWLSMLGESTLAIVAHGRIMSIEVVATLDGEIQAPTAYLNATWNGRPRDWPGDDAWQLGTAWMAVPRQLGAAT